MDKREYTIKIMPNVNDYKKPFTQEKYQEENLKIKK